MPTRDRARDRGLRRSRQLLISIGTELREARIAAGVSQDHVARVTGLSQSAISRAERVQRPALTIEQAAIHAAALGLQLSVKTFPVGAPVRDAAQLRLLARLRTLIHSRYEWRAEVPIAGDGDYRAWDALLDGPSIVGVEAETRLRDVQALQRRVQLKVRDSGVEMVVLLVADTVHNRSVLRQHRAAFAATFPGATGEILRALRTGRPLARSGVAVL